MSFKPPGPSRFNHQDRPLLADRKIEYLLRSDKVEANHMEQCNMDLKWIEAFLSVLKYQVLLEYLVIYSSYKTACSLVHQIEDYTQPKNRI